MAYITTSGKKPRQSVSLEFKGWEGFQRMMNHKDFEAILARKVEIENKKLAQLGAMRLTKTIRAGKFTENSPLTIFLKKSSKPLVDHGDLIGSVEGKVNSNVYIFDVGVKKVTPNGGHNLAHMLETGWAQKVTPTMRRWFAYQARQSDGRVKPLKSSTTHIKVPSRPYMRKTFFMDKTFQFVVKELHRNAVHQTYLYFKRWGEAR
jgi:hypothetical protein